MDKGEKPKRRGLEWVGLITTLGAAVAKYLQAIGVVDIWPVRISLFCFGVWLLAEIWTRLLADLSRLFKVAVLLVTSAILITGGFFFEGWLLKLSKKPVVQAPHLQPALKVHLVIRDDPDMKGRLVLVAENISNTTVTSIGATMHTNDFASVDGGTHPNELPPGAMAEIPFAPTFKELDRSPVEISITYRFQTEEGPQAKYNVFRFSVDKLQPRNQPIYPTFSRSGDGLAPGLENSERGQLVLEALKQPVGTVVFDFPEKNQNGQANVLTFSMNNKTFYADSISKRVSLSVVYLAQKRRLMATGILPSNRPIHRLALTWDDNKMEANLYVEGKPLEHHLEVFHGPVIRQETVPHLRNS